MSRFTMVSTHPRLPWPCPATSPAMQGCNRSLTRVALDVTTSTAFFTSSPFRRSSFLSIFLFWIPFKEKTRGFICTLSVGTPASKRLQYLESTSDTTLSIGSSTAVGCALVLAFSPLVFPSLVHPRISTAQSYRSPASPSRHVATDGPLKLRHHVCHLLHLAVLRSWRTQG